MRTRFLRLVASALALATSATVSSAGPVDSSTWETVDRILGRPGKVLPGDIHKYGWPRSDLHVVVGSVQIEPTLALGSWGGFLKTSTDGHVMTMGDLVLLSDEVNPVIRALQAGGLDVLAIHNHLIGESPQVIYVHFGGHGPAEPLARALRGALDATKAPLAAPTTAPTAPSAAETAAFDTLQTVLGRNGSMAGRVLQVGVPRAAKIEEDGMEIPSSLGMATALNFQFVGGRVATTGDFVLIGDEVNPVIQELQSHGIQVTALHSHMLRESPRLFFMHFWGLDDPARIALGLKAALGKIAVQ
jgi:biotin operon repressor